MHRKFYLSLLLISSLVLLTYAIMAGYREVSAEWKGYQQEYKRLLILNAKDETARDKAESFEIGHKQIYLGELHRVDRCMYCHLGVENPLMADARQPFRQHSGDLLKNHPVNKFGCTVCHNGQGRATNKKEAHGIGRETHWDRPLIPASYIQGSCAQCHDYEMLQANGGTEAAEGEELFRKKGCRGCHKLNGVGGDLGKVLDGIGSQPFAYFPMKHILGENNIYTWIKEHFQAPWRVVPDSQMRAFLSDEESNRLTTYILTLRKEEIPKPYRKILEQPAPEWDGKNLYTIYCIACHAGGKISLYDNTLQRTIPAIRNPAFLRAATDKTLRTFIMEGRKGTPMTAWKASAAGLNDGEIDRIIGYLAEERPADPPAPFDFLTYQTDVDKGKEIFTVSCLLCHGEKGEGGLGVNLRNPVLQKMVDPEFLALTIRDGREGTPMPPFGDKGMRFSGQEIADVVAYVKTFSGQDRQAEQ